MLLLPHTDPVGAWQYCERLRCRIEKAELLTDSPKEGVVTESK